MKTKVWSLYLALLNVHYGLSATRYNFFVKKQRRWEPVVIGTGILVLVGSFMGLTWTMTGNLYQVGLTFEQPQIALVNGVIMVATIGFFFGFFYILSAFYFSNDLSLLIPLPFEPWEILMAKLGVVLTAQYLINALILIPSWFRYAVLAKVGLSYIFSALVTFIVLPIIPLAIATLLIVILMRLVNFSRHRDKMILIGGILLLVLVLGFQVWLQSSSGGEDPELLLQRLLVEADGLTKVVGRAFPPSLWVANAMVGSTVTLRILNLFYLIMASLVALGSLYFIGHKVFLQGVIAGLEGRRGGSKKKAITNVKSSSVFRILVFTEIKLFLRDPNFALNGLAGYAIIPLLAFLPFVLNKTDANLPSLELITELPALMLIAGIALFFMFMTAMSMIPSTTFSREGKYIWLMQSLPLSIQEIVLARICAAQLINTVACLLALVPLTVVLKLNPLIALIGACFGLILATTLATLLLFIDLLRPMLDWVNPIKAIKSNLNAMLGMLLAMVVVFVLGGILVLTYSYQILWLIPVELAIFALVLGWLGWYLWNKYGEKLWRRIEYRL